MDAYQVPQYEFEDWHLLAAVPLGLFAALVTAVLGLVVNLSTGLFGALKVPGIVKSTLGGVIFGFVGVALPLTMFTGSAQLNTVLADAGTLGIGLLIALLIGKMITFGVSQASGFVGGPIFPALFIGGTAGILVHQVIPGVPLGLAFTCLLAAVPGSMVAAPFTMVLLAAFMTQVVALQTAPSSLPWSPRSWQWKPSNSSWPPVYQTAHPAKGKPQRRTARMRSTLTATTSFPRIPSPG